MIEDNGFLIPLYSEKTIVVQIAVTNKPHKFIDSYLSGKHTFIFRVLNRISLHFKTYMTLLLLLNYLSSIR